MKSINNVHNTPIYYSYEAEIVARNAPLGRRAYLTALGLLAAGVALIEFYLAFPSLLSAHAQFSLAWAGFAFCCLSFLHPWMVRELREANGANHRILTADGEERIDETSNPLPIAEVPVNLWFTPRGRGALLFSGLASMIYDFRQTRRDQRNAEIEAEKFIRENSK